MNFQRAATRMKFLSAVHRVGIARNLRRILCAFFVALSLCLAVAATQENPESSQAKLYFFNTSGWKAIPEKVTLLDNNQKAAAINREQFVVLSIAPGHHVLQLKEEHPPKNNPPHQVNLDAKPGATYYVSGGYSPSMHTLIWTFTEITKSQADTLQSKFKSKSEN
jgi:hypothetical protein